MSYRTILLIGSETVPCKRSRCFDEARIGDEVLRVSNVNEALDYLRGLGSSAGCDMYPALVLVWSTVGSKALVKLLSWIRDEEHLKQIPIVVLTSVAEDSQAGTVLEASSKDHLVRSGDTDTLLDVVSKYLPENGSLTRTADAC